jgi:hypothetical protein
MIAEAACQAVFITRVMCCPPPAEIWHEARMCDGVSARYMQNSQQPSEL